MPIVRNRDVSTAQEMKSSIVADKMKRMSGSNFEFVFPSGSRYIGSFTEGKISGHGVYYYHPSGDVYEGEWENNKKHGQGTYTYASGDRYIGSWVMGQKHGHGTYLFASGDEYVGYWNKNKMHGFGAFSILSNGSRYEGFWKDSLREGRGVLYSANGDIYDGNWVQGKENGLGIFMQANNADIYCVEWKDGQMHGKGILRDRCILYAMEFVNGDVISRVPIADGMRPEEPWRTAYDYFIEYTGIRRKQAPLQDNISQKEADDLRAALEKSKMEVLTWRKRYEVLRSKQQVEKEVEEDDNDILPNANNDTSLEPQNAAGDDVSITAEYATQTPKHKKPLKTKSNQQLTPLPPLGVKAQDHSSYLPRLKQSRQSPQFVDHVDKKHNPVCADNNPNEINLKSAEIDVPRREVSALMQQNAELQQSKSQMEKEQQALFSGKAGDGQSLRAARAQIKELEVQFEHVRALYEVAQQENNVLLARIEELKQSPVPHRNGNNQKTQSPAKQQGDTVHLEEKLKELNRANAELQIRLNAIKKNESAIQNRYNALVESTKKGDYTTLLTDLQDENETLTKQLMEAEEVQREQRHQLDAFNSRCIDLESKFLILARQKTTDKDLVHSLDQKIDAIRKLQEENAEISRLLEETGTQLDILNSKKHVEREKHRSIEGIEAEATAKVHELQKTLEKERKRNKKISSAREKLANDLYKEQVNYARVDRALRNLQGHFTVLLRVCGATDQMSAGSTANACVQIDEMNNSQVVLTDGAHSQRFQFDVCLDERASWDDLVTEAGRGMSFVPAGFHVAFVTFGAYHTGKTTMLSGIMPLLVQQLCKQTRSSVPRDRYTVQFKVAAVEVSASGAIDCETQTPVKNIQRDAYGYVVPKGATFTDVFANGQGEEDDVKLGESVLSTISSLRERQRPNRRSHLWIQVQCIVTHNINRSSILGRLTFVDLCGPGPLLTQEADVESARFANRSFTSFFSVLEALQDSQSGVPYTSALETALLADVLGGNALTTVLANVSSRQESYDESAKTLRALEMASKSLNAPILPRYVSADELRWREVVADLCSEEKALPQLVDVNDLREL